VIVCFVDLEVVDHHYLNVLFIIALYFYYNQICLTSSNTGLALLVWCLPVVYII